jgi:hypothetical protein
MLRCGMQRPPTWVAETPRALLADETPVRGVPGHEVVELARCR